MTATEPFSWAGPALGMSLPPPEPAPVPHLRLRVTRPTLDTAVISAHGELDATTAPRLSELLMSRLRGNLRTVVVDLSTVEFLAAAGISVLVRANLLARSRGIALRIHTGRNRFVTRPLTLTGLTEHLDLSEEEG
ncbi:STAS domain-containing protein [Amycolatopsis sp. K13G38]|uniref:Anti-sigma factor antagonist n=1 Tax=Amycolatopsis acididurans TaxID=2724524 RepID=A0ABX1IXC9_9PSEU|nr:STAS domain-containing protein [Amycolatopsis acididurans]NKQ52155.1 STAS domain-containing protein [Amycolatopsis acididurans]